MNLSKRLVTIGLAMSLGVMSVVPAFAATTNIVDSEQNESTYTDAIDGDFENEITMNIFLL